MLNLNSTYPRDGLEANHVGVESVDNSHNNGAGGDEADSSDDDFGECAHTLLLLPADVAGLPVAVVDEVVLVADGVTEHGVLLLRVCFFDTYLLCAIYLYRKG